VVGEILSTSPGGFSAGVRGRNLGTGINGIGVWGSQAGGGWGVYGTSLSGIGVYGQTTATTGAIYGVFGETASTTGRGVYGRASNAAGTTNHGVYGLSESTNGVDASGVYGESKSIAGNGVYGVASATSGLTYGVYGRTSSPAGAGVNAEGTGPTGTALRIGNGAIKVPNAHTSTSTPVFIHRATAANIAGSLTDIDHPMTNGAPTALLIVTTNQSPPGAASPTINFPVGVIYNVFTNKWAIINQSPGGVMPVNAAFNVLVVKP
jgi:hypothetical protein